MITNEQIKGNFVEKLEKINEDFPDFVNYFIIQKKYIFLINLNLIKIWQKIKIFII